MNAQIREEAESGYYHVIARGVNHCEIFFDDRDRTHFLDLLSDLAKECSVTLFAWCLMSNHYHLLVNASLASLGVMMRRLNASYALYFNTKYERDGHLFQGRFKSVPIESDEQFLTVVRYIHQNPEKAGICRTREYPWSSYRSYLTELGFVDTGFALSLLGGKNRFVAFHANLPSDNGENEGLYERACSILQGFEPDRVASLNRDGRNGAIRALKAAQFSTRQIEQVTGISRSTVSRVK
jgi:REP element-mobilizing transposase RayT